MSSEKSTLSAKTSQTSFSHLSTAEKVFEQSKKNFDLKTGQANEYTTWCTDVRKSKQFSEL